MVSVLTRKPIGETKLIKIDCLKVVNILSLTILDKKKDGGADSSSFKSEWFTLYTHFYPGLQGVP